MRILRLNLLAFGSFTDCTLPLAEGQYGLQLVYGANEAGKSSALRGLTQFLYGFPRNSNDNFLHAYPNLRIGGVLQRADGEQLECIRRKAQANTLRDADDVEPIDEAHWEHWLDGVNEETFRQQFGLDYDELVSGGKLITQAKGELGSLLFAAGAGIANLNTIKAQLDAEAKQLFKPQGQKLSINRALADYKAAGKRRREHELPSAEYLRHDEALRDAKLKHEELAQELRNKTSERAKLERVLAALPLISVRRAQLGELSAVADAPWLSPDFAEQRRDAASRLAAAQQVAAELEAALAESREAIEQLEVPPEVLEHATAITDLHAELGSFKKAAADRPGLAGQQREATAAAEAILQKLGREPDLSAAESLRLGDAQRRRIQTLGNEFQGVQAQCQAALKSRKQLEFEDAEIQQMLATLDAPADAERLRRAVRDAQRHGDLHQRVESSRREQAELASQAEIQLAKLPLWTGSLADLEKLPLPADETLQRFADDLAEAKRTQDSIQRETKKVHSEHDRLEQELRTLELETEVPTVEELAVARRQRDAGWDLIRCDWLDVSKIKAPSGKGAKPAQLPKQNMAAAQAFIEQHAPGRDLADAFENSVRAADALADRLRREADRVAKRAQLEAARGTVGEQLALLADQRAEADAESQKLQAAWLSLWRPLEIGPLPPREMLAWRQACSSLTKTGEQIRDKTAELAERIELEQSLCDELAAALGELGAGLPNRQASLPRLLELALDKLKQIEALTQERATLHDRRQRLTGSQRQAERDLETATEAMNAWRRDWSRAVQPIGLDENARPAEASDMLDLIRELLEQLADTKKLERRVAGIDRDAQQFSESVGHLVGLTSPELLDVPVELQISELYSRLNSAQQEQARREEMIRQQAEEGEKLVRSQRSILELSAKLKTMCGDANCATPAELPAAERRSDTRQTLTAELRKGEQEILRLAGGMSLEDFVAEASRHTNDELVPTIARLSEEMEELGLEKEQILQTIGSERRAIEQMDGGCRAAEAREEEEQLLAQIAAEVEQYKCLRHSIDVLSEAIERYREKHQGSLLSRAGEIFAELTRDAFEGLRAEYTPQGNPQLICIRQGGQQTVGLDGLSEGTECQLYLALRLASLESYLEKRQPMPFVVDDILKDFDDERAVAALKTLARLSEKTQVILFTHHRHLVRLAEENLDHDVLFVHNLDEIAAAARHDAAAN